MEILSRLSEWSELDWHIAMTFIGISLVIWTIIFFFIHVYIVRKNVKIVEAKYDRLVRPYLFGDNNQTVKEQSKLKTLNKDKIGRASCRERV